MADYPKDLKYTKEHEWARPQGAAVQVGITFHAQEALGDVVYVELPKVGDTVTAGQRFGTVESTKAASDLYAPITGKVTKVNDALSDAPQHLNTDPYGQGWLIEVTPSDAGQVGGLMDASAYEAFLASGGK
jgi:glycine cleavage system H protein